MFKILTSEAGLKWYEEFVNWFNKPGTQAAAIILGSIAVGGVLWFLVLDPLMDKIRNK